MGVLIAHLRASTLKAEQRAFSCGCVLERRIPPQKAYFCQSRSRLYRRCLTSDASYIVRERGAAANADRGQRGKYCTWPRKT